MNEEQKKIQKELLEETKTEYVVTSTSARFKTALEEAASKRYISRSLLIRIILSEWLVNMELDALSE